MDVSDIFFSAREGGRGSPRGQDGGGRFFIENPTRGGGGFPGGGGAGRVSAANWGIFWGGG